MLSHGAAAAVAPVCLFCTCAGQCHDARAHLHNQRHALERFQLLLQYGHRVGGL